MFIERDFDIPSVCYRPLVIFLVLLIVIDHVWRCCWGRVRFNLEGSWNSNYVALYNFFFVYSSLVLSNLGLNSGVCPTF